MNTELNRALTLLNVLEDDFSIFDTQNPTENNRMMYAEHCGEIYAIIESAKSCIERMTD